MTALGHHVLALKISQQPLDVHSEGWEPGRGMLLRLSLLQSVLALLLAHLGWAEIRCPHGPKGPSYPQIRVIIQGCASTLMSCRAIVMNLVRAVLWSSTVHILPHPGESDWALLFLIKGHDFASYCLTLTMCKGHGCGQFHTPASVTRSCVHPILYLQYPTEAGKSSAVPIHVHAHTERFIGLAEKIQYGNCTTSKNGL